MSWGSCNSRSENSPPRHFLVRAGHWCRSDGVTNIVLGSSLKLLRDHKGDGEESKRRRIVSVVKGESIVSVATNEREMERKRQVTTPWRKPCSLFHSSKQVRMKTKSKDLPFIQWPFEGRCNPKIALRPSSTKPFCGPRPIMNGIHIMDGIHKI